MNAATQRDHMGAGAAPPEAITAGGRSIRGTASSPAIRGRDRELAALGDALGRLRSGSGAVVLIEGAAGMGKSRLIAEGVRMARRLSLPAGVGDGDPLESAAEMAPLLRALFDGPAPLLDRARLADLRAVLDRRYWMLEDLQSQLEQAALAGPMLVCLDDLQWADAGTVAALRVLPARLASLPVGWVLAARAEESPARLAAVMDQLEHEGATRLALAPLSPSAVARMTAEVMHAEPEPELLAMAGGAGGNPFLLVELLLGLREEQLVHTAAGRAEVADRRLPGRVNHGMRQRLALMSESARQLATVAASLGRSFSFADLAAMLAAPPSSLLTPTDQLVQSHILRESDGHLAFRHDLIREAVRGASPVSARRALDRQAAEVLLAAGAVPTEVAAQLAASADPGDLRAVSVLGEAAEALGRSDPGAAAELAHRALELTPKRHPLRGALLAQTTLLQHAAGHPEEATAFAQQHLKDVLPIAEEAAVCLSIASMFGVSPDVRVAMSRRALALSPLSADDRARHWSRVVYNLVQAGRAQEARSLLAQAQASVRDAGDEPSATILMLAEGALLYVDGSFEDSLQVHETAMRRGFGPGEETREWVARHWRSELLANLDRLQEAMDLIADGIVAAQRGRQDWAIEFFEIHRGRQLLQRGQILDARAALEGRVDAGRPYQIAGALYAAGLVSLGRVAIHIADHRLGRDAATVARAMHENGTPATRGQAAWLLALQAMAEGNPQRAFDWVTSARSAASPSILPLFPMDVTDEPQLVRIALAAGDRALAELTVGTAETRAERNPGVNVIAGIAAHARGLLDGDAQCLSDACSLLSDGRRPLALASALEDQASLSVRRHDRTVGVEALSRALVIYADAGATWDAGRVRARLRAQGVRRRLVAVERPSTGWEALTASELTVARFVSQGLTNRETAERLFVSPHTVNSHLRHTFTKLGVNSRTELSQLINERGRDPQAQ